MAREPTAIPESDRFEGAPHPRETLGFSGAAEAERALLEAYQRNRLAQAWIVGGPEGVGKATLAWRMARFLLAHPDAAAPEVQNAQTLDVPKDAPAARQIVSMALADIFLLRRAWNEKTKKHFTEIRIEDVRRIISAFHQGSGSGGWRVCIVDCADDLNRASANALLKLIEEPPERALFLLVAHQPGRMLPTIRSRCRKLMLAPLEEGEIVDAVRALGPPWADMAESQLAAAAAQAEGSVREALRLVRGDGVIFDKSLRALFDKLPQVDWGAVHMLADKLAGRDNEAAYETFMRALHGFLDRRVRAKASEGAAAAALVGYANAWDEIIRSAHETDVFNFDKKALVVGIFNILQRAEQAA